MDADLKKMQAAQEDPRVVDLMDVAWEDLMAELSAEDRDPADDIRHVIKVLNEIDCPGDERAK